MIDIIAKIMKIKNEKQIKNEIIFPDNPSYISKLKRGDIKMPTEQSLRTIAANYEMSFDDLIHGTNWNKEQNEKVVQIKEFAISPNDIECYFDNNGGFSMNYKTYTLYNSKGEKNEFCPLSGSPLITECNKCKRNIEYSNQLFCVKCGNKLLNSAKNILYPSVVQILSKVNIYDVNSLEESLHYLSEDKWSITEDIECISNLMKNIKKINSKEFKKKYENCSFQNFRLTQNEIKIPYSQITNYESIFNEDKSIDLENLSEPLNKLHINSETIDKAINYYKSKLPDDIDYVKREKEFQDRLSNDENHQALLKNTQDLMMNNSTNNSQKKIAKESASIMIDLLIKAASKEELKVLKHLLKRITNKESKEGKK